MIAPLSSAAIPAVDEALRIPVREFARQYVGDMPPEIRARSWFGFDAEFSRLLARRGWIGLTLPAEFGGGGRGYFARFVVVEELLAAGAPVSAHWIADRQSGPLIARFGTDAQKRFYLPRICRAEAFFCIGMSEPNAGSDLAGVTTRAERTHDGWRLNGRKIWTTNAPRSHYMITLARTSGTPADRHKGLSQLIVDLSLPGVTIRPIRDLVGDAHFSEIFLDDVELPPDALVGVEGAGWDQVNAELAFERSGPERIYSSIVLLDEWLAATRRRASVPVAHDAIDLALAGRAVAHLCTLREMAISVTDLLERGQNPAVAAALVKDLGTEFEQWLPAAIADAVAGQAEKDFEAPVAKALAYLVQIAPMYSLRGGTREILRGILAHAVGLR
ncbi:MAG: acyl-CoA dehydrogenase family protein [Burkholderiaceae bacterium]|nr:acyl-CoA dehydrogenase family protein [Burkholderiaceae bacterium]